MLNIKVFWEGMPCSLVDTSAGLHPPPPPSDTKNAYFVDTMFSRMDVIWASATAIGLLVHWDTEKCNKD